MTQKSYLKIALIQASLAHGELKNNLAKLLELNRLAAGHGAQIIVNTEMGLSGYLFPNRDETALCALPRSSRAIKSFASLARESGVWLCLGFAEKESRSGILFNCAVMFNPQGRQAAMRRKVTAEPPWACPGPPSQRDVCDTPWGRIGLLICSETYFGLLPRVQALKGIDLLLCPANWPKLGLDPVDIWRARAWENGIYLAACNRAGREGELDFSEAHCCLADPQGNEMSLTRMEPEILMAELPLKNGKLATKRKECLAGRRPEAYYPAHAAFRQAQADMGTYYQLPEPGRLQVHCLPQASGCSLEQLSQALKQKKTPGPNLFVLPAISTQIATKDQLHEISRRQKAAIFTSQAGPDGGLELVFCDPGSEPGPQEYFSSALYQIVDWGPARLGLALVEDLNHPELALSMAKQGCDFGLGTGDQVWQAPMESLAIKCLERVALACALPNMGFICLPPKSHDRWQESVAPAGGFCSMAVDTTKLRQKFFMDFVDYQRLFQPSQDA